MVNASIKINIGYMQRWILIFWILREDLIWIYPMCTTPLIFNSKEQKFPGIRAHLRRLMCISTNVHGPHKNLATLQRQYVCDLRRFRSNAPLILRGVTIGRSDDWLFGDDFLRHRRVRVSMRHLKSPALSTRRDFKARVEVAHQRGHLFQNFDVAHCLSGSIRNLRLQSFRSHHRAFQIGPVDRQDQVGLAGKESLDVHKRRVVHLDQEFLVIVRLDQVDGESCYSASATNSACTAWNGSRFVSPSTWKAETCGTLEPRLAVPGMISKRGSKSTMSEASCFRIARLPCVLAVPSAIIASSFFLPIMASSRSERLTVIVRSGFGDWKP